MRWSGKVAIITGASRGIGEDLARAAVARGARVGLVARAKDDLERVLASCGGSGAIAVADVADRGSVEAAIEALRRELGPADILVNNAGYATYGSIADDAVENLEGMLRVNYLGTLYTTKAVLPDMIARGSGHVVNVCSMAGFIAVPREGGYCASKFAVTGFSEALAAELAPCGIRVSTVNPGPVATSFFEARGHPYVRKFPKPVPPARVTRAVIRAVEREQAEVFVPAWYRAVLLFKALAPPLYRASVRADYRKARG
ncbi:MAG: SDR family NAD(P)-dependent oxidoreductase [Actinomycetota bacterium]